jgi:hypothetical protein
MKDYSFYRVTCRSDSDSIWVREEIFIGSLTELINRFGSKKHNPLQPFKRDGKTYVYYFTQFQDGFWHSCKDPRKS